MTIKKLRVFDGTNITARLNGEKFNVYVNNGDGVYKGILSKNGSKIGTPSLFMHCDEIIETRNGHIEIRGNKVRLVTS